MGTAKLFESQKEALDKMKSGCILCGGVGSGKSITSLAYYWVKECGGSIDSDGNLSELKKTYPLYIITTARKRDTLEWDRELARFMLSKNKKCSYLSTEVIIDSWNNLHKYTQVTTSFFIFDEQKVVGSGQWVKSFLTIAKHNHWILLSATPGDTWIDYIPVFIANGFYRNRTEFIREHIIYKPYLKFPVVDRYVGTAKLERLRKSILVPMERQNIKSRHTKILYCSYDSKKFLEVSKKRWDIYRQEPIRDMSSMCYLMRRVCNEDNSRLNMIKKIMKSYDRIIIFYNFDYELEILKSLEHNINVKEWNGHRHDPLPKTKKWIYLVQYNSAAEGWNCTDTNVIVFYSLNYSYKITEQSQGRIDRLDSPFDDLYYYFLTSHSSIDSAILKTLYSKKTFNEKIFLNEMGES